MSLTPGSKLACYEIVERLGSGAQGSVYRARDHKLGREVALKIFGGEALDRERRSRIEREARVLASLSHPGIATIYELAEADGQRFIVMELVSGETLAYRLRRAPLPLPEARSVFERVAHAVAEAHDKGVLHRDLKPSNIMLGHNGTVKLLDFGLAKRFSVESHPDAPTVTRDGTTPGAIVGTVAYMSPEQVRGQPLDRRCDVWAFGSTLFESLTGTPPFLGETVSDTLAKIVSEEPPWHRLPGTTPPRIKLLLKRCLEKESDRRLRDLGDARLELLDATDSIDAEAPSPSRRRSAWIVGIPWAVAALAVVAALVRSPEERRPTGRFIIPTRTLPVEDSEVVALSSDGAALVYVGQDHADDVAVGLYWRRFEESEARQVVVAGGESDPFVSPDGEWIGFFADDHLHKVSIRGGAPVRVAPASSFGGCWRGDRIVFVQGGDIVAVSASTDVFTRLARPDPMKGELSYAWPELLDRERVLLYTVLNSSLRPMRIMAKNLETGRESVVVENAQKARRVGDEYLVYVQNDQLVGARFDPERLQLVGTPVTLVTGVFVDLFQGAQYDVSRAGVLSYVRAAVDMVPRRIEWVSLDGSREPLHTFEQQVAAPNLSPSAELLAVWLLETHQIGVLDIARQTLMPLSTRGGTDAWPLFTPDGTAVVFQSDGIGRGGPGIFLRQVDGSGDVERLTGPEWTGSPGDWADDGGVLLFRGGPDAPTGHGLFALELSSGQVQVLIDEEANESQPALSPDGRFLAYVSDETGRPEVFVTDFPTFARRHRVSKDGGQSPQWAKRSSVLYFRSPDGEAMWAVDVVLSPEVNSSVPRLTFEGSFRAAIPSGNNHDLSSDDTRFVMIPDVGFAHWPKQIEVVLNWDQEVERLVGASDRSATPP